MSRGLFFFLLLLYDLRACVYNNFKKRYIDYTLRVQGKEVSKTEYIKKNIYHHFHKNHCAMERFYIYSISVDRLPGHTDKWSRWNSNVNLYCVDEQGNTTILTIDDFEPYVFLLPTSQEEINDDDEAFFDGVSEDLHNRVYYCKGRESPITNIEFYDATPVVGFTNNRTDKLIKVTFKHAGDIWKFKQFMTSVADEDGTLYEVDDFEDDPYTMSSKTSVRSLAGMEIDCILHHKVKPQCLFLYDTKLTLQSWIAVPKEALSALRSMHGRASTAKRHYEIHTRDIAAIEFAALPVMTFAAIRMHCHSSTATRSNMYSPNASVSADVVRSLGVSIVRNDEVVETIVIVNDGAAEVVLEDDSVHHAKDEGALLSQFGVFLRKHDVMMFVQASDADGGRADLVYLNTRFTLFHSHVPNFSLGLLKGVSSRELVFKGRRYDFTQPGCERLDIVPVLQKFMTSPPLDGFTLSDALSHPKLVKNKEARHPELLSPLYSPPTTFSLINELVVDLSLTLRLMIDIVVNNRFVQNHLALSKSCDLNLSDIVERGQQTRVFNCFMRTYHIERLYINHKQFDSPYVVVRKAASESTFPDPEWLQNGPLSSLREGVTTHQQAPAAEEEEEEEEKKEETEEKAEKEDLTKPRETKKKLTKNNQKKRKHDDDASSIKEEKESAEVLIKKQKTTTKLSSSTKRKSSLTKPLNTPSKKKKKQQKKSKKKAMNNKKKRKRNTDLLGLFGVNEQDAKRLRLQASNKNKKKKKTTKGFAGGFVIEPTSGFYVEPEETVLTLDFGSLYPSIITAYIICFMRVLYDRAILDDPLATLQYVPLGGGMCCVFVSHYAGEKVRSITDKIVSTITENRKAIRRSMKTIKDKFLLASLNAAQLSAKVLQNGSYGFLGSKTSGMLCTALAASVCLIGQWMNKTVRHLAMSKYGCRVVYGDTDSVFIQIPTDPVKHVTREEILSHIHEMGEVIAEDGSKLFPPPNVLEFECAKRPFLLTDKKKTYGAREIDPDKPFTKGHLLTKGFAFKKRDRCAFVQRTCKIVFIQLLDLCSDDEIVDQFRQSLAEFQPVPKDLAQLQDYVITTAFESVYKSQDALAPAVADAIEAESGVRPTPGRRLPYVIVSVDPKTAANKKSGKKIKLKDQVCSLRGFLKEESVLLDAAYYLRKQLLLPLNQLLSLECHQPLLKRIANEVDQHASSIKNQQCGQQTLMGMISVSRQKKKKCNKMRTTM
jgi:DNA polymerase elongation subunit (family B)